MAKIEQDMIATTVKIEDSMVCLKLEDGSSHSFPILYYPRLAQAEPEKLHEVKLRVGGRALRRENLDEDIWIADAVCQNYPVNKIPAVAEPQGAYGQKK